MKDKAFLMMVFSSLLLFGVIENIPAQNTQPIIGYDKVPWGSSYDAVKRAYPALSEKRNYNDGTTGAYFYDEGIISARYFSFYNDKLYHVQVIYETNISPIDMINVIGRIIQVYGLFDESWSAGPGGSAGLYIDNTTYYRRYSRELTIQVDEDRGFEIDNARTTKSLTIFFSNPLISAQINR